MTGPAASRPCVTVPADVRPSVRCVQDPQPPIDGIRIRARGLPASVVELRRAAAADDAAIERIVKPRVEALLAACKIVAQDLEGLHARYADATDLDLTGYSRASALWLLSGRVLGLLRALLVQIEVGIGNEALVTGRAIHEAARVLFAFSVPDADDLVRVWLDDAGRHGYVKQGPARDAEERFERLVADAMRDAGMTPPEPVREKTEQLYDRMSRSAHNRRSSCVDAVWEPGRRMAYGYNPTAIRRASYATWAASMTTEVTNAVGDALRALYSQERFFTERITPLLKSIDAVRAASPLDEASIRRAAGTG